MKRQLKIQIGLRLLFASVMLFMGNFIMAALCLTFPGWNAVPGILANGLTAEQEKEQKEFLDKVTSQVKSLMDDSQKENVKKADLEKRINDLNDSIKKLNEDSLKELKERVDKLASTNETLEKALSDSSKTIELQGAEIKKLTDKGIKNEPEARKTFREAVREAIMEQKGKPNGFLKEITEDGETRISMKDYFSQGKQNSPVITVKAAVDMLESNIVQNQVNLLRLTALDPNRVGIPLTIYPHVMNVFNVKNMRTKNMALLVVYDYWDGADTKVEGAASGKSSFLFKTVEFKSFFIATFFTLSDETLDDLEEALDEISIVAPDKIMDKIDEKILGDQGDDASDIAGILTANKNTAFANPFTTDIEGAYIVDVIAAAALQCKNNKYRPNAVYLNPADVVKLAAKKNTFEDSQYDRRVQYDVLGTPVNVGGLRILESTSINENELIVFDSKQPWIGRRKEMTMEIGYNGTDLTEGQKTVVIKIRLAFGVRDKAGIIYVDDIDAAIAALAGS